MDEQTTTQQTNTPLPGSTSAQPVAPPSSNNHSSKIILAVILLAVIITLGLIVYMMYQNPPSESPVVTPTVAPEKQLNLTITSPADETLAVGNEILVSGTTSPNTTVAIYTETDETIVDSDATGAFETTVTLSPGINNLVITAFSDEGQEASQNLTVVYDDEQQ